MSTRFEILKNGEPVCISGIDGDGVLSVGLNYVKRRDGKSAHVLRVGGLGHFDGSRDQQCHADWPTPWVTTGDEITIRILPPGEFEPPEGMTARPQKTLDDPELGRLDYYIDAWIVDITFDSPPIETARVRLLSDESGPTPTQRHVLSDLPVRHAELWPEISAALVRCHPEIKATDELERRLVPHIGIHLDRGDAGQVQSVYSVYGDPEFRAYFVTLRDGQVAEVCMAE